jgi:peptidoglycan pentaglycine glycine transferase (the first glycine)
VLERDGEVVGLGQFLVYNTAPVPGDLWYCTKGPWLPWEDEEAVRAFFEGVVAVAGRKGAHTVKIEPEVLEQQEDVKALLLDEIGFRKARYDLNHKTTMFVDLEPPEEDFLAQMKGKTRYNVRLAVRKGIEVGRARLRGGLGYVLRADAGHGRAERLRHQEVARVPV